MTSNSRDATPLKEHCHGDFFLGGTNHNKPFSDFSKIHRKNLKVAIHFHSSHQQPNIMNSSFCALVGLLLTKLNHYFNDSIETNMFLAVHSDTKNR